MKERLAHYLKRREEVKAEGGDAEEPPAADGASAVSPSGAPGPLAARCHQQCLCVTLRVRIRISASGKGGAVATVRALTCMHPAMLYRNEMTVQGQPRKARRPRRSQSPSSWGRRSRRRPRPPRGGRLHPPSPPPPRHPVVKFPPARRADSSYHLQHYSFWQQHARFAPEADAAQAAGAFIQNRWCTCPLLCSCNQSLCSWLHQ